MLKIGYIFFGWALGILSTLFTIWLQSRKERKKIELSILSDTLRYLFKIRQIQNNLMVDKEAIEKISKESSKKVERLGVKMIERFDNELATDFFPDLLYHSFQLNRLRDKSFWKDFEDIMDEYQVLTDITLGRKEGTNVVAQNKKVLSLISKFNTKCISKTKL